MVGSEDTPQGGSTGSPRTDVGQLYVRPELVEGSRIIIQLLTRDIPLTARIGK